MCRLGALSIDCYDRNALYKCYVLLFHCINFFSCLNVFKFLCDQCFHILSIDWLLSHIPTIRSIEIEILGGLCQIL